MTRPIDSDALDRVNRMLGIGGGGVVAVTQLDDGNVSQILVLNEIIRRSRTPAATTGWYLCVLENAHAGAGALASSINPYSPTGVIAPYPDPVPAGFDFYVLKASVIRSSGTGTLDGAVLNVDPIPSQQGWGRDDSAAAIIATPATPLAFWHALNTSQAGQTPFAINTDNGLVSAQIMMRIPRGALLRFGSDVAGAAADIQCLMICGLFPEAVGQDVAS